MGMRAWPKLYNDSAFRCRLLTFESSSAEYSMFLIAISTPKPGSCSGPPAPWNVQPPAADALERHASRSTGRYTYLTGLPVQQGTCFQRFSEPFALQSKGEKLRFCLLKMMSHQLQAALTMAAGDPT